MVERPRLTSALADRFDVRLTTITAAAGFGKTTALAQARHSNELDPRGDDLWLGADEADADPTNLLDGLVRAAGAESTGVVEEDLRTLCDAVWQRAPREVAIIIDDVHLLGADCGSLLNQLLEELPTNGHLVLAGRSLPELSLGRLRARHDVVELDESHLRLDQDERDRLRAIRSGDSTGEIPGHAASADLMLTSGRDATADYLWEEVLGGLDADRLLHLSAVSVLDEFDDELATAVAGTPVRALELVEGLPLVESHVDGSCRLHALLREPLAERLGEDAALSVLRCAAVVERNRNNLALACQLFARAGAVEEALDTARTLAAMPTLRSRLDGIRQARRAIASVAPESPLVPLFEAHAEMNLPSERVVERWERVARIAQANGDNLIEAVALYRAIQAANQGPDPLPGDLFERICALAPAEPYAQGMAGHVRSWQAQGVGDATAALRHLDDIEALGSDFTIVMRAERLCDLGRPEDVGAGLGVEDLENLPPGAEIFISFAMWLRAELAPEVALPIANEMLGPILARGWTHTNVSFLGVITHIAAAAGRPDEAAHHARATRHHARIQGDVRTTLFASVADAVVAVMRGDEDAAACALDPAVTGVGFGQWPARPHLLSLATIYLLRPETREVLDRCDLGPALSTAVDAGRALVALRDGSVDEAVALPWDHPELLRVHVLPPLLTELAVAASAHGVSAASGVLSEIGHWPHGLSRAADCPDAPTAAAAADRIGSLPTVPATSVEVRALGPLELARDGVVVADADWVRRARVRELMALLVEFGRVSRDGAAAHLWPDLEPDKATSNLRVTLSHLHRVLEPERNRTDDPACVLVAGDTLELSPHVTIDTVEFVALADRADSLDRAGAPGDALALYRTAASMVRGSYLDGVDASWASASRTMLDSRARGVLARLGELELARGEPEVALSHAAAVLRLNELDERAARLMVGALLAVGDRAGAFQAASRIEGELRAAGLDPELETRRVIDRVRRAAA